MPRTPRRTSAPSARRGYRDRHGRGIRGPVTGPHLPILTSRIDVFEMSVASMAEYLRDLWPDDLAGVTFEVAGVPAQPSPGGVERWTVFPRERRILLYRVPIERLARLHRRDDLHKRMLVESCVVRAVAELLGRDPWDIAPERYQHF